MSNANTSWMRILRCLLFASATSFFSLAFTPPTIISTSTASKSESLQNKALHVSSTSSEVVKRTRKQVVTIKPQSKTIGKNPFFVQGPPPETKPDYENIHGPLGKFADSIFLRVFRMQMAKQVGIDSKLPQDDYKGLMELTAAMNARYSNREEAQAVAKKVLVSLFPSWMPKQYSILFAKPFPEFSARMNAWATMVAGTWLMGECEINDVEIDGQVYKDQGLLVKRCRFLEESGCASVCVNSCKIPTQNFFQQDMGLPLTMTPDYETHECQFTFGQLPDAQGEIDAKATPCLSRCPTSGGMKDWHDNNAMQGQKKVSAMSATTLTKCQLMDAEDESLGTKLQLQFPSDRNLR